MEGTVGPEAQSVQGKENVMVSSQRADRYWKPGSRGTAGCRLAGREGLFEIGNKRACVRRSDVVW